MTRLKSANNAKTKIFTTTVLSTDLTCQVTPGTSLLFPPVPFRVTVERKVGSTVTRREIAEVTNVNTGTDTLTWTRAIEACPSSDTATSQTQIAKDFASGDSVSLVLTSGMLNLDADDYQKQSQVFANDTGTANAYVITLTPAPTAYITGQCFTFKALNSNTGASTINVNGLGVKSIKKNVSSNLLSNDIFAGQMAVIEYDGTNFQLSSNIAPTIPSETIVLAEAVSSGDAICIEGICAPLLCDSQVSFGNATTTQYQAFRMVGNGIAMTSLYLGLKKVGAPADNCILAIQADSAGSPSGVDLQTATIAGGTLTTSTAEYNPTITSITPTDKTPYWVVCRRSGALDAVNYYQIAVHTDDTVAFPYKTNNAGAWSGNTLTESPCISGAGLYPRLGVKARATLVKLSSVEFFAQGALGQFVQVAKSTVSYIYGGFSGLKPGRNYFLSNTPGAISLTPGTISQYVGNAVNTTSIKMDIIMPGTNVQSSANSIGSGYSGTISAQYFCPYGARVTWNISSLNTNANFKYNTGNGWVQVGTNNGSGDENYPPGYIYIDIIGYGMGGSVAGSYTIKVLPHNGI